MLGFKIAPDCLARTPVGLVEPPSALTAADAQDWIIKTSGNSNYFVGGCVGHDTDAGGDDTYVVDADGNSNSQLTVYTPIAGTWVKVVCNGLLWYINGSCVSATDAAHAFADQ